MRMILKSLLEQQGHSVVLAESGANALQLLEKEGFQAFDMILSDYWMPEINGMELLKRVGEQDPTLSVVLLTADEEREILENLIRNGGCAYLRKPLDKEKLIKAVETACKKTRQLRSLQSTAKEANKLGQSQRDLLDRHLNLAWKNIEFYFTSHSQASGDFFSAIDIGNNQRLLLASDSSGHDLSSAFQSSYFHGLARGMLHQGASIEDMLNLFNELILNEWNGHSSIGLSLAACALHFDFNNNSLSFINAGFPRPIRTNLSGFASFIGDEIGQPPLGWFPETYQRSSTTIPEGYLYLWSDGLTDLAEDLEIDPLSLAHRLLNKNGSSDKLLTNAMDDIAVMRLNPTQSPSAHIPIIAIQIPGDAEKDIEKWQAYVEKSLRTSLLDTLTDKLPDILICLREGLINALAHGCQGLADKSASVQFSLSPTGDSLSLLITDPGSGHNFDTEAHAEVAADELIPEHRGMIMMQSIPDHFESSSQGSSINMCFNIPNL